MLLRKPHFFCLMDSIAALIWKFDNQSFTCTCTKALTIITVVIALHAMNLLKKDTVDGGFLSVIVDTSNHKAVKPVPVVIRYFTLTEVISVKDFSSLRGETSTLLFNEVLCGLSAFGLMKKLLGFC